MAKDLGTKFFVRISAKRMTKDGGASLAEAMTESLVNGCTRFEVEPKKVRITKRPWKIKFEKLLIQPPMAKAKRYPA